MLKVYYKEDLNQKDVMTKSMTNIEFEDFKKAISDKSIIALIIGIEPSYLI